VGAEELGVAARLAAPTLEATETGIGVWELLEDFLIIVPK
jgi:hypothetical protein